MLAQENSELRPLAQSAAKASKQLRLSSGKQRQQALLAMKKKLLQIKDPLLETNAADVAAARQAGLAAPLLKRLAITEKVFAYMVSRLQAVADLEDPVGRILEGHTNSDGLQIQKISIPIGVIALIYESRPNVTTDAASVCLKSGNAVILRGGKESLATNRVLASAMQEAVVSAGLPSACVQLVQTTDHAAVSELLTLDEYIDLIIPRGGKGLIKRIAEGTRIPVLKHYEGICQIYLAEDAPERYALDIVVNSKCQSVAVCNALETLLIDARAAKRLLPPLGRALGEAGVELRGCPRCREILPDIGAASEEDWSTEYLAPILSLKIVDSLAEAVAHISEYGSGHTDGIITASLELARRFVAGVDSASVLVNASTRLSGGGAYGLGSVVGISTDKLHARGPVGPRDLCSYKWVAYGQGQIRS